MTISPLVSVVCAVHNALPYLPEAMQSILSQTFSDLELIIVDDASTDGTVDYVKSLDNPRVRLIRREKSNLSEALNAGIADARADLIARIDGDDIALPHRIENQYRFMTENPEDVLVGCQMDRIDEQGKPHTGEWAMPLGFPIGDAAIRSSLFFQCVFLHPGVMYRTSAFQSLGGYNPHYSDGSSAAEDYDLWTRLSREGSIHNLNDTLMKYRVHSKSISSTRWAVQIAFVAEISRAYAADLMDSPLVEFMTELVNFVSFSRTPELEHLPSLIELFSLWKLVSRAKLAPSEDPRELECWIEKFETSARWKCLALAKKNLGRPWVANRWIHAARGFDPRKGGVEHLMLSMIRKRMKH